MKPKSTSQPPAAPSILALAVRRALLGGLWLGCGSSMALAAGHPGLPESINQGQEVGLKIPDLTRPALHRGIDVGHASGTFGANGRSLTVDQTTAKAILDWNRFDIAAGNAVRFNQPSASAVVLNQIHQSDPSRIFGALTANGQVYLINQNGFLFGKGAQVDTNTLVVSTLAIKDENFAKGITKVVDSGAGGSREPVAALTGDGSVYRTAADGSREKIGIRIEQGASLHGDGGRVLLAAPAIENRGEVRANGGQVILAAATDKVYLQEADPKSDLRGLLVEVKTGGSIDNLGKVIAGHGNSTLVGFAIHQQGLVSASTTVALGGSVRLLARENATLKADGNGAYVLTPGSTRRSAETGDGLGERAAVTLGQGSRTTVKLDGSGGSAVDGQDQPHSQIDIEAGRIVLKSGSTVRAKGGDVSLIASESPGVPLGETSASNGSRILIERDATVDVSGSRQSTVAMERNVVDVELRDNELRDAPLQKDGVLHGKTIAVDLRKGTPLADITGATARIRRSVQERNSAGGTIGLSSEGDVVVQGGSTLNVAGGQVRYRDGYVKTSRLLSGGQVIDVAAANPDRTYQGIDPVLGPGRFEQGYTEGKAAGSVTLKARDVLMEGRVVGDTVNGRYQRTADRRADGASLIIDTAWSKVRQQDVTFAHGQESAVPGADDPFPQLPDGSHPVPLVLGLDLFKAGLRHLVIDSMGSVSLPADSDLQLGPGASVDLTGGAVAIAGSIHAPAGAIRLATRLASGTAEPRSGQITVASGAELDTSGLWVNDTPAAVDTASAGVALIHAGDIAIRSVGNLVLEQGSRLVADGGAWLRKNFSAQGGDGGDITLASNGFGPTRVELGAAMESFGFNRGGRLDITANGIAVADRPTANSSATLVTPELFENRGFGSLSLTANSGSLAVADVVRLDLRQHNLLLADAAWKFASARNARAVTTTELLPLSERAPVDLCLNLRHSATAGGYGPERVLSIGSGAVIGGDPGASLDLVSDANIRIDGTLNAPAGHIGLTLTAPPATIDPGAVPDQAIDLGREARLLATGATEAEPNHRGLDLGTVLDGGIIEVTAKRGSIQMDPGARLDVSGSQSRLDVQDPHGHFQRENIASSGGTIRLTAAENLLAAGDLKGAAGTGLGGAGGSLSVTLDPNQRSQPEGAGGFTTGSRVVHLVQRPKDLPKAGDLAQHPIDTTATGNAWLAADQVKAGGFSNLTLSSRVQSSSAGTGVPDRGEIRFDGDVELNLKRSLVLDAPAMDWSGDMTGAVTLGGAHVALGSTLNRSSSGATYSGLGQLKVQGDWIDLIGSAQLNGFATARLSSRGDLRMTGVNPLREKDLVGSLVSSGNLELKADQIYPTTYSRFAVKIDAGTAPEGALRILPGDNSAATPLSAGGSLTLAAPVIDSQGVLKAPFGQLALNASNRLTLESGSLSSVSGAGTLIPYGRTQGGLDWIFPLGIYQNLISAPPEKRIELTSPGVTVARGATVDLSGGGDLSAFEFISGPGGKVDQLNPTDPGYAANGQTYQEKFAVLPQLGKAYAPYDPIEFPASGLSMGDSVYLAGGGGLTAGTYVLLPARYALLPGAFLVTPRTNSTDFVATPGARQLDGAALVAGYRVAAGSGERDARWSGFAVEAGSQVRIRSEYQETTASRFFASHPQGDAAPTLPADAGNLTVAAQGSLALAGDITGQAGKGGRGGELDLTGERVVVVGGRTGRSGTPADGVAVSAEDLNRIDLQTLVFGGRREGNTLRVQARSVAVADGVKLAAPEIVLAARENVVVGKDARLTGQGDFSGAPKALSLDGSGGTLLRVSSGDAANFQRPVMAGTTDGSLQIGTGAVLTASGSMLLDATGKIAMDGRIDMRGGDLELSSSGIALGRPPADPAAAGLILSQDQLDRLGVDTLALHSYGGVDLSGAVGFSGRDLTIDAAGLSGYQNGGETAALSASRTIQLFNTGSGQADAGTGAGHLVLDAPQVRFGDGTVSLAGFAGVEVRASDAALFTGHGQLKANADLTISAAKLTATAGANATVDVGDHALALSQRAGTGKATGGLGASLAFTAGTIDLDGTVELPAGSLKLTAVDDVTVGAGARIDVAGKAVDLGDAVALAPGGSLSLRSSNGDVVVDGGARINLAGAHAGGSAGLFELSAGNGQVRLGGGNDAITATAGAGYRGGRITLDTGSAAIDFGSLNDRLAAWGFDGGIGYRQRTGNLAIGADDRVAAGNIDLAADQGRLTVNGALDASGTEGGRIHLAAGDGLSLGSGSRLLAAATAASGKGGTVSLESLGSRGVAADPGARIDVSGAGGGGSVAVRVARGGADDAPVNLSGIALAGAAAATVEAVKTDQTALVSNADIARWREETATYMNAAAANFDLASRLGGFRLLPGVEVRSGGDVSFDLSERLNGRTWSPASDDGSVWVTTLNDLAGPVETLSQVAADGTVRRLTAAIAPALIVDGSYYFDVDPASPTFRQLFVRSYADPNAAGADRHNPARLSASLVETNSWNLLFPDSGGLNWHFGTESIPGVLTVRAGGNLTFNQGLSDGFALDDAAQLARFFGLQSGADWLNTWVLQGGESWSYHLVAGADLGAASAAAVQAGKVGDLNLGKGVTIRTGTGDIDLAAAGDIRFGDSGSTVYTAGRPDGAERYGSFDRDLVSRSFFVEYPEQGGDIRLAAGGDIVGAATPQLLSGWLRRTGAWNPANGIDLRDRATAWGIAFDDLVSATDRNAAMLKAQAGFQENVGALAGGDVTVAAGGSVRDLSVVVPTSGKPVGTVVDGVIQENRRTVQGGGSMSVSAGADIAGGVYYLDRGEASLRAGGAITGGSQWNSGPLVALGDTRFGIEAGSDIDLGAVFNPMVLAPPRFADKTGYFTTYSATSSVDLQSLGGALRLNNDVGLIASQYRVADQSAPHGRPILTSEDLPLLRLYPGSLTAHALSGELDIGDSLTLYPAPRGQLELLAAADIRLGSGQQSVIVNQSDVDPASVLSPDLPAGSVSEATRYLGTTPIGGDLRTVHATTPVHADDPQANRIVSRDGSIIGSAGSEIVSAKAAQVSAGQDLFNLGLSLQNLNPADISTVRTGNDIRYPILRDPDTGEVGFAASGIRVAGPGSLLVVAGGDIDLGASDGVISVGPLLNSALPATGADLTVLAGSRALDPANQSLDQFLQHYVTDGPYAARFPGVAAADRPARLKVAVAVLFDELRAAARVAAGLTGKPRRDAYQRGYAAIDRLFPDGKGDLKLFFSRIHTLAGGDIRMLASHGSVNAGLASAFTGNKTADQLGIVAQRQGSIEALSHGDFQVNQSRVFTLDGGDITIWSSAGDIDAGRGAKASLAVAPPIATVDAQGNLVVVFPPSISGSGIRAQSGYGSSRIGDVMLIAPRGVVDAGEAGIGGQNITVVAKGVIGVDNIQALGKATGLPQTPTVAVTVPGAANSLAGAAAATEAAASDSERERVAKLPAKVVIADYRLSAQLVGLGQCTLEQVRAGKPGCGG